MNFTVTRGSLQSQCLNQVLKAERPDVDAKRSDLLKLQGTRYTYVYMAMFREEVLLLKSSSQHHRTKLNTLSSLFFQVNSICVYDTWNNLFCKLSMR